MSGEKKIENLSNDFSESFQLSDYEKPLDNFGKQLNNNLANAKNLTDKHDHFDQHFNQNENYSVFTVTDHYYPKFNVKKTEVLPLDDEYNQASMLHPDNSALVSKIIHNGLSFRTTQKEKHKSAFQHMIKLYEKTYKLEFNYLKKIYAQEMEEKKPIGKTTTRGTANNRPVYLGPNGGVFYFTTGSKKYVEDHTHIIFY